MRICYFVERPDNRDPRFGEIYDIIEAVDGTVGRSRGLIETCLNVDPRSGVPSPPKNTAIHSFEIYLNDFYTITPVASPIGDFLPWFNALQVSGGFHVNYDYSLERFQTEIVLMSLQIFSSEIKIAKFTDTISFEGSKDRDAKSKQNHSLRDGELSFFLKYS